MIYLQILSVYQVAFSLAGRYFFSSPKCRKGKASYSKSKMIKLYSHRGHSKRPKSKGTNKRIYLLLPTTLCRFLFFNYLSYFNKNYSKVIETEKFLNHHVFEQPLKNSKAKQVKVVQPAMTGDTWVVCPVTALLLIGFAKISLVITGPEVGVRVFFAIWKLEEKRSKVTWAFWI